MGTRTSPVLAHRIHITDTHLVVVTSAGRFEIPWERCSEKLAEASPAERSRAELSPSGYGIHWPLLDEDLAVGPLVGTVSKAR
ncbi:MAG: DUF2442 domain-containing protein [Acidobacteriota bacterium]